MKKSVALTPLAIKAILSIQNHHILAKVRDIREANVKKQLNTVISIQEPQLHNYL